MALVTSPTLRTHSSKVPLLRLGEELIEIGASPMPNSETSTNWPGSLPRLPPSGSSRVNSFSSSVICSTLSRRAIAGR